MKYKIIFLVLIISFSMGLSGCKKYLDITPYGINVISTTDQYNGLFNNTNLYTYYYVRNVPGSLASILGYAGAAVVMADDIFSSSTYLSTQPLYYQNAFEWQDNLYQPSDDAPEWGTFYSQIYVYNLVSDGVMNATGGTVTTKQQLLAEARVNRALMHLMVANYFAKPYNVNTASTDPGIPIVTTADAGGSNYSRGTVKQVYDFIISELNASIPNLPVQTVNRARLAQTAGYYVLGLTYFWMNDYTNALKALNNCRNSLPNYQLTLSLYNYNTLMPTWATAASPWLGASKYPSQTLSNENIYVKQMSLNWATARNTVYLKPSVYNLFTSTDQRKKLFYNNSTANAIPAPGLPGQQRNAPTSCNWGPNLADLYLMLAECEARTGDIADATTDLQTFRQSRMSLAEATVTASTPDALIKLTLNERLKEFASTGWRWFDMRRLSNDAVYNNIDPTHPLDGNNYTLKTARLTLKIPPAILNLNPGMADNN
jgi:hypothetical protein